MAVAMLNCRPVLVPLDDNYQIDVDAVRRAITPRTRAIVTISPNNPTRRGLFARGANGGQRVVPRARASITSATRPTSISCTTGPNTFRPARCAGAAGHTISLYSLSKAYGFASWRVGYMVIPEPLTVAVRKAQDTILICPPVISQIAAVGALSAGFDFCRPHRQRMARVHQGVLEELEAVRDVLRDPRGPRRVLFPAARSIRRWIR